MAGACNSSVTITPMERAQAKQKIVGYMKAQAAATIGLELDLSGIAPYVDQVEENDYAMAKTSAEYHANINTRLHYIASQLQLVSSQLAPLLPPKSQELGSATATPRGGQPLLSPFTGKSTTAVTAHPLLSLPTAPHPPPPSAVPSAPQARVASVQTTSKPPAPNCLPSPSLFRFSSSTPSDYNNYNYGPSNYMAAPTTRTPPSAAATPTTIFRSTQTPGVRPTTAYPSSAAPTPSPRKSLSPAGSAHPAPTTVQHATTPPDSVGYAQAESRFWSKLAVLRNAFGSALVTLCKRVEERQDETRRLMDDLQAKLLPTLTAMELKPLQAQLNAYNMQKTHQKVLLDRMHVFQKLFSFTRENHRFDQGVDTYLVDICEQQFRHWLQQLQMQTNQDMAPASSLASGPAPTPSSVPRPAAVPSENVRQTPVGAAPPAPIATPAPAQTGRADFEVVNLVEVELRQEREAAKRELEEKRQKIIEYEATIAKLERKENEWKAKYLELASKQLEPTSQPSEPQPMGTESSCTTPTAAIVPLPAVPAASSESLPEPQSDDADHILWQGSAVPRWCEGEVAYLEARARPSQEYAHGSATDVEQWPTQLLIKGVCSTQHASASIAQVVQIGYRVPRLVFTPAGRAVESFVGLNQDLQAQAKMGVVDCIPNMTMLIQPDPDDERQLFAYLLPRIPLKQAGLPPGEGNNGEGQGRKRNRESGRERTRTAKTTTTKKKSHEEVYDEEKTRRSFGRKEKKSSDDDFEYHHEEDDDDLENEDEVDEFEPKEEKKKGKRKTRRIR